MASSKETSDKIVFFCTTDDPERAYPAFFMASAAVAMDIDVVMYFCMSGLNIIRKGGAAKITLDGVPKPLNEYVEIVREGGGKLVVCSAGLPVMKMTEDDLIPGPEIAGAPSLITDAQEADFVMTF